MKIDKSTAFPYPVLGFGDDILSDAPAFAGVPVVVKENGNFIITVDFIMDNEDIQALVSRDFADYVCEADCTGTFFRKCFVSKEKSFRIKIPVCYLKGVINFTCTIVVKRPVYNYVNSSFNDDYKGFSFNLKPGDLLAYIGSFTYDAEIQYDKLHSIGSIMQITEDKDALTSYVNLDDKKIEIVLPSELFDIYKSHMANNILYANIIHASLVFNALLYSLYNFDANRETLWARSIRYRIESEEALKDFGLVDEDSEFHIDMTRASDLAQALLGDPYKRLFSAILMIDDGSEED